MDSAQLVRDRADIVEVIGSYVELKRAGATYKARCPFHNEKTPSFNVSPQKQVWHCFGCHKGGDVFAFVMAMERVEFREALELLARRYGIELPRSHGHDPEAARVAQQQRNDLFSLNQWAVGWFRAWLRDHPHTPQAQYFESRKFDPGIAESFFLGASPDEWRTLLDAATAAGFSSPLLQQSGLVVFNDEKQTAYDRFRGRIIFPIHDVNGRPLAFGGRIVVSDPEKKLAKYVNSNETPIYKKGLHLYGLYQGRRAIEQSGRAMLVEGYVDCIACHQFGFREAVASLGTALTLDQARLLARFAREVIFVYDGDEAGQKAMRNGAEMLVRAGLQARAASLPPEHDPDSLLRAQGPEGFRAFLDRAVDIYEFLMTSSLGAAATALPGHIGVVEAVRAVEAVAPLLLALENPVERELRIAQVAKRVGVEPRTVVQYLQERAQQPGAGGRAAAGGGAAGPGGGAAARGGARPGAGPSVSGRRQNVVLGRGGVPRSGPGVAPPSRFRGPRYGEPQVHPEELAHIEPARAKATPPAPISQTDLLRKLLDEPQFLSWIMENLDPSWLQPEVGALFQRVIEEAEKGAFDPIQLMGDLPDAQRAVLSAALFSTTASHLGPNDLEQIRVRLWSDHLHRAGRLWIDSKLHSGAYPEAAQGRLPREAVLEYEELRNLLRHPMFARNSKLRTVLPRNLKK